MILHDVTPVVTRALVQILGVSAKWRFGARGRSGGEDGEPNLWCGFAIHSKLAQCELPFPDPMHEFDARDRDRRSSKSFEPKHWTQAEFDASMILFNQIIEVL
jgi:hypothetical protein